jgi:Fe-Mn family superoxide dismutase
MVDRRDFLAGLGAGALGAALAGALPAALGQEAKGGGGGGGGGEDIPEPKRVEELHAKPLKPALLQGTNGISARTHQAHHKLYEKYVESSNKLFKTLAAGGLDPAATREAKLNLSFQLNGAKNHAIYFDNLGGPGGKPEARALKYIERDFGGYDKWEADLRATALGARGWVWLAFDFTTNRLFNFIGDAQNEYPVWDAAPILALDMYEHAYWADFLTDKPAYIDAFLKSLDWKNVEARLDVELKAANVPSVD